MNVRITHAQKIKVLNSEDIFKIMQQVLLRENKIRRNQEHFWIVGLDQQHKILFIELISLGAVNAVQVKPREVFRMAIYKLAVRMILVHNHPSGETNISANDRDITDRLLKSGELLGIQVIDHLIITEQSYVSLADEGVMQILRDSGTYQLIDQEKAQMQQWRAEVEKEKAIHERSLEIAKKMKADGQDDKIIRKYTGLSQKDINAL